MADSAHYENKTTAATTASNTKEQEHDKNPTVPLLAACGSEPANPTTYTENEVIDAINVLSPAPGGQTEVVTLLEKGLVVGTNTRN